MKLIDQPKNNMEKLTLYRKYNLPKDVKFLWCVLCHFNQRPRIVS